MQHNISKRNKIILMILLVLLNLLLRIPSIPHEKGSDSFFIHALANSITTYGIANWWVNSLAVFGLYPNTYASSIPFLLSGVAQVTGLTGLDMEKTILLFSVFIGLFSIFTVYSLAGLIYDDFLFKYLMALFFSASQGTMIFSTWEISARGTFIIVLPLFIYVLLKKIPFLKVSILLLILGLFLASTHHYYIFIIPLTLLFIIIKILSKAQLSFNNSSYINYLFIIGLFTASILPFFTRTLISTGSRYTWIIEVLISNTRYVGPIIVFIFGGLMHLILKINKKFEEWYFLGAMLILTPFMYSITYGAYIIILFIIFFITIAIRNILYSYNKKNQWFLNIFLMAILLSFVLFSGFYNHHRTGRSAGYWYMPDITYQAAAWTNSYIPNNMIGFGNEGETWRLFAASDAHPIIPTGGATVIAYKLIKESDIEIIEVDPGSLDYYFEGPYIEKQGTSVWGGISWLLEMDNINSKGAISTLKKFNMRYFIEDVYRYQPIISSIQISKNNLYNNGRIRIWGL